MNIKAEMAGSPAPELLDRRNAQARHDRWALEMDKALFSALPPAAEDPVRQPGQYAWQAASGSPTALRTRAEGGPADPAQAERGAAGPKDEDRNQATRQEAGAAVAARSHAQAAPAQAEAAGAAAASSQPAPVSAASADPVSAAFRMERRAPGLPVDAVPVSAAAIAGFAQPAQAQAQAPAIEGAGVSALQAEAAPPVQMPAIEGSAPAFALPPEPLAGVAGPGQEEGQMEAAPAGNPPASGADEEYAQHVLHLYQQNGEVQAWIRDVQLQPNQAGAVAQALAMQLSAQGTRLATLTINGREVELPTEDRPRPAAALFDEQLRRLEA